MAKHSVKATMESHELAKNGSGIELEIYGDNCKLGTLSLGQGSMQWTSSNKQKAHRIDWTTFAQKMEDGEFTGWHTV